MTSVRTTTRPAQTQTTSVGQSAVFDDCQRSHLEAIDVPARASPLTGAGRRNWGTTGERCCKKGGGFH